MPVPDGGSAARAAAGHARRDYAGALGRDDPRDPPHPEVISVMAWYGIKIASHRSRAVCPADLARASLVLPYPGRISGMPARAPRRQGRLRKRTRADLPLPNDGNHWPLAHKPTGQSGLRVHTPGRCWRLVRPGYIPSLKIHHPGAALLCR